jgi:hypothetical protein
VPFQFHSTLQTLFAIDPRFHGFVWTKFPLGAFDLLGGVGTVMADATSINIGMAERTMDSSKDISKGDTDSHLSYIRAVRHELMIFIADKA